MKLKTISALALALAALLAPATVCRAQESLAAASKKIFDANKDSVVWISAVAKVSLRSADGKATGSIPDREQKAETLGTIIDASGLSVAALSTVDPSGREVPTQYGLMEAAVTLKEVKIILPDGTEVPADLVMKDADLDLAFFRPKADSKEAKGATFKAIDLKNSAKGGIADDVTTLSRADELLNRQPAVTRGLIAGMTQKPRVFLRVSNASPGCPTFAMDGKLLGIGVNRISKGSGTLVVLPAADVLEIAEQAKAAKPIASEPPKAPEEKKSAAKDEKKTDATK